MGLWQDVLALLLVFVLAACAPSEANQPDSTPTPPPPTLVPTETPEYNNLDDALLVGTNFLDLWRQGDFLGMYQLVTVESQQTVPYESFLAIYQDVAEEIRLIELDYTLKVASRENNQVIVMLYDVTFNSNIIGEFTDADREMRLVLDDNLQAWRVAWTPGNIFAELAGGARLRMETFVPRRASIYDRDGEILADMNGQIITVSVVPGDVDDMTVCVNALAQALEQPPESIQARMANFGQQQLGELGLMERERFNQWRAALESNCNAQFDNMPVRRYINGELAPHIIGYVGYPNDADLEELEWEGFRRDSIVGRSGIERSWQSTLGGRPGGRLTIVSLNGNELRLLGQRGTEPGQSVYLTIDADLQRMVLETISEAYENAADGWGKSSEGGSIIVYEIETGAVLAMVSYPTYNANAFNTFPVMGLQAGQEIVQEVLEDERRPQLNRAAQGGYPNGSTMKPMTAIAAIDSGVFAMDERYVSVGVWDKDIPRVDYQPGGHGSQTLQSALTVSCNTCFYEAGYRLDNLDPYLLPDYAARLGLGKPTGIGRDIPETAGVIGNPDTKDQFAPDEGGWKFSDAVNMAIGQGFVEVSPLQLVRMYAAIATDGTLMRPQLVDRAGLLDEISYTMMPEAMSNVDVDQDILAYVRGGLCDVVSKRWGTAEFVFRNSRLQEMGVCGKTGTAQDPLGRATHAWFVGYAPRENPQIAVIAMIENAGEGSAVAAPIVRDVMEYYFYELER